MSPTQQPGQLPVLQLPAVTQVPVAVLQTELGSQVVQAAPLIPQDFAVVAMTHWLPTQQPEHVSGPHGDGAWQERAFG
jgi:hypothetical protein